ncbi:MAG: HD domain-containing protein [Xanthomonadales bacterium]|nr:HD domain-containing protein [Xanthomonadales bacterium]
MESDPAHDITHIKRVVNTTSYLTELEDAVDWITLPAACLHDCVAVSKDSDRRSQASRLAADAAVAFLRQADFPTRYLDGIYHAIEAHSFSANIAPRSVEARVVQDADRLEALGAIGIARCLMTGGSFGTALYSEDDPFCEHRSPDERAFAIDHFYQKLLGLPETMQTQAGRAEAERRVAYMHGFLAQLRAEIDGLVRGA